MTQPRLTQRRDSLSAPPPATSPQAVQSRLELRRVAEAEPQALLGVVAYWLGSSFPEGGNRVDA